MAPKLADLFAAAKSLRDLAAQYQNTKDPHTRRQSDILFDMAQDVIESKFDHAKVRYHSLHVNIRSQLSFAVLDLIGLSEYHVDD